MAETAEMIPCEIKRLPTESLLEAARIATDVFPGNAPPVAQFAARMAGIVESVFGVSAEPFTLTPQHVAALTDCYWGPKPRVIPVSFLDNPDAATRRLILEHANLWDCGITFAESSDGVVRIARASDGYWSYLGTGILSVRNGPTMNLQGFTSRTRASEYMRVVVHEFGHTLGFPHEHMRKDLVARIDRQKAIAYFGRTQGWAPRDVEAQVLTPLDERSIMSTPADQTSIMCYQLPGSITTDGHPIPGGDALNATDLAFADKIYPRADVVVVAPPVVPPVDPPVVPTPPVGPPAPAGEFFGAGKVIKLGSGTVEQFPAGAWLIRVKKAGVGRVNVSATRR